MIHSSIQDMCMQHAKHAWLSCHERGVVNDQMTNWPFI